MAESLITKHLGDGVIELIVNANVYEIKYEDGDLALDIPGPDVSLFLDRGKIADTNGGQPNIRYGDEKPMTGSFSCFMRDPGTNLYVTASQFVTKTGLYASTWGTTMGANGEVKTVDLRWTVAGVVHGDAANRRILLPYTYISGATEEGRPNKVKFNFTSFCVYPVIT